MWWLVLGRAKEEKEIANDSSSKVKVVNCSVYSSSEEENKVRYGKKMIVGWSRFKIKLYANTVHLLMLVFVSLCFLGKWEGWKFIFHPSIHLQQPRKGEQPMTMFCIVSTVLVLWWKWGIGLLILSLSSKTTRDESKNWLLYWKLLGKNRWGWIWRAYLLLNAKFRVSRTPFPSILYQFSHKYYISSISTWRITNVLFSTKKVFTGIRFLITVLPFLNNNI